MKKSLLLALSVVAIAALAGCSEDAADDSSSSTSDIVAGDPRDNGTGANYGVDEKKDEPLPELPGDGAEGSVDSKKLVRLPANLNIKPALDFPRPLTPAAEQLPLDAIAR